MNGYYSTASESEATVASTDRMDENDESNEEAKRRRRKRRDRLRGAMAIQVYPPTWAVAESNDLLWLMRMPWRLLVEVRVPPRSSNQPEIITFLRVDSYIDVRPSAQRTRGVLRRSIKLHSRVLGPHNFTRLSKIHRVGSDQSDEKKKSSKSHRRNKSSVSNMTNAISRIATAKRRADSHNRNVILKRRTKLSPQSSEFSSQIEAFDEVRIPPDADLTVWVCIGMHVISVDGEVSEALPLVPIKKQVEELHRPHHPPHIGMALFQGQKKNPRVQFERALQKYTGANWCCKISASRRRDALSTAESNGERT